MTEPAFVHTFDVPLKATAPRVFAALTTRPALEAWYAEHAAVALTVGGVFACWGRYSYGTPSEVDARGRITAVEPDRRLAFTWTFDGADTEVTWTLAPRDGHDGQTTLTVTHRFATRPSTRLLPALVDDLWRLQFGNLANHLKGEPPLRVDFADPSPQLCFSIEIAAPPARVFHALTDPDALRAWVAVPAVKVDLRVGGRYEWGWTTTADGIEVPTGPTTILELVPNEKLVTDWPDWRGDPAHPKSRVSWILEPVGPDRTKLTLRHDHFWRPAHLSDYAFGWPGFLEGLRTSVEDGGAHR